MLNYRYQSREKRIIRSALVGIEHLFSLELNHLVLDKILVKLSKLCVLLTYYCGVIAMNLNI